MAGRSGSDSLLEIVDVSKRFGGVQALKEVSLSAKEAEITGLIGPNGAGKSTLLAVIGGAVGPDAGEIYLDGVSFGGRNRGKIARRGLLRTFQQASPIPELTVIENVLLGASQQLRAGGVRVLVRSRGLRRSNEALEREARSLLERLGLTGVEHRLATELSFGQLRLLEVARALLAHPRIILLDEPVAGLNSIETAHLGRVLSDLVSEGIAVLVVDHDIPFMLGLCKKVYVLDYGAIIASGTPEEVERDNAVRSAYLGDERTDLGSGEE